VAEVSQAAVLVLVAEQSEVVVLEEVEAVVEVGAAPVPGVVVLEEAEAVPLAPLPAPGLVEVGSRPSLPDPHRRRSVLR
jgi:hypothetical protein